MFDTRLKAKQKKTSSRQRKICDGFLVPQAVTRGESPCMNIPSGFVKLTLLFSYNISFRAECRSAGGIEVSQNFPQSTIVCVADLKVFTCRLAIAFKLPHRAFPAVPRVTPASSASHGFSLDLPVVLDNMF